MIWCLLIVYVIFSSSSKTTFSNIFYHLNTSIIQKSSIKIICSSRRGMILHSLFYDPLQTLWHRHMRWWPSHALNGKKGSAKTWCSVSQLHKSQGHQRGHREQERKRLQNANSLGMSPGVFQYLQNMHWSQNRFSTKL